MQQKINSKRKTKKKKIKTFCSGRNPKESTILIYTGAMAKIKCSFIAEVNL